MTTFPPWNRPPGAGSRPPSSRPHSADEEHHARLPHFPADPGPASGPHERGSRPYRRRDLPFRSSAPSDSVRTGARRDRRPGDVDGAKPAPAPPQPTQFRERTPGEAVARDSAPCGRDGEAPYKGRGRLGRSFVVGGGGPRFVETPRGCRKSYLYTSERPTYPLPMEGRLWRRAKRDFRARADPAIGRVNRRTRPAKGGTTIHPGRASRRPPGRRSPKGPLGRRLTASEGFERAPVGREGPVGALGRKGPLPRQAFSSSRM